ncbi:hypothetical protein Tco_0193911 [Tanacetum coccineum]
MHASLKSHFDIALRVLKYLKLAPGLGVNFSKRKSECLITAFSDSDWAKCLVTRRHATLSKSSAEAEYGCMASTTLREKLSSGLIKTVKVDSKNNVADILSKALGSFQHRLLTKKLGAKVIISSI